MTSNDGPCQHGILQLDVSPFAELAGYVLPTPQQRAAAHVIGRPSQNVSIEPASTFPAPLVLPHDDLNYDPDCPPQSVKSWAAEKTRNKLTKKNRNVLYIAQVPNIGREVGYMRDWSMPVTDSSGDDMKNSSPSADLFVDYLEAFYHGMNVQLMPGSLSWTAWGKTAQPRRQANLPKYVGLSYQGQCTRIRVRKTPDGTFPAQLNLDDIIDVAISILPDDAYALLVLVDYDIYESDDDDFCCGRAYGGSRVAVVQTARYNPALDVQGKVDRDHMWPFSHCKDFVDSLCAVEDVTPRKATKQEIALSHNGPMKAAVEAAATSLLSSNVENATTALWFSRLARTVSHELGHCFGLGHCVYYACNLQGTAGMKEDLRQPPYLCTICETKVAHALVVELQGKSADMKAAWVRERCSLLVDFCDHLQDADMATAMWQGLQAWCTERSKSLQS